jgi:hypothetical protein
MAQYDSKGNEIKLTEQQEKERKAAFEAIQKKAILVNMTRSQISNMPFDVKTSRNVAEALNVKDNTMIQVRKFLFLPQHLSTIRSLINDAMLLVWNHTRPWDNTGFRLLPMEYYDDFTETFGKIKDEFEEAVREFIQNYDDYVAESKRLLGKAFNKNDYPSKDSLPTYFALDINTAKFPDIDDVRLNLTGAEVLKYQTETINKYDELTSEQIKSLCEGAKKLGNTAAAIEMVKSAEHLNITNNSEMALLIADTKESINFGDGVIYPETDNPESLAVKDGIGESESMMVKDDLEGLDEIMDDYL